MGIKVKTIVVVSLLLVIIGIITAYSIPQIQIIRQKHDYSYHWVYIYSRFRNISWAVLDTSRLVNMMVINRGDTDKLPHIMHDVFDINRTIRFYIDDITLSIRYDPNLHTRDMIFYTNRINELDNQIQQYMFELVSPIYQIALNDFDNKPLIFEMLQLEIELYNIIHETLNELIISTTDRMIDLHEDISLFTNHTTGIILLWGIIGMTIGVLMIMHIGIIKNKLTSNNMKQ